jgi:hypothetical protein
LESKAQRLQKELLACKDSLSSLRTFIPNSSLTSAFLSEECEALKGLQTCSRLNGIKVSNSKEVEYIEQLVDQRLKESLFEVNGSISRVSFDKVPKQCIESFVHNSLCLPFLKQYGQLCDSQRIQYLEDPIMNECFTAFNSRKLSRLELDLSQTKLAFIITTHKDTQLIVNLLDAIYDTQHHYFIHVDGSLSSSSVSQLKHHISSKQYKNVIILEPRFNTSGDGISLIYAHYALLLESLSAVDWMYAISLTENDYPIKSTQFIQNTLTSESINKTKNFIGLHFPVSYDYALSSAFVSCPPNEVMAKMRKIMDIDITKVDFYSGGESFILNREFVEYLATDTSMRDLLSFFHTTKNPSKFFFATALMNSPFKDSADFRDWHFVAHGKPNQRIGSKDIPSFSSMKQFFVQKVFTTQLQKEIQSVITSHYT